ncbi:hypothetical protein B0H34DRAFT_672541 [Crassisporium funariophilum]|nr:hypothetical protein B0H34DRAFT_672541 [Crassisporium funariophilum]
MAGPPSVLNIHTPTSSFAIVHSLTQETILDLYNKLSRKTNTDYHGQRVGPGWLKYEYNDAIWNLDDDSDYTIFVWRRQQHSAQEDQRPHVKQQQEDWAPEASTSRTLPPNPPPIAMPTSAISSTPTLHLHNPATPLPTPPAYLNASYYMFQPSRAHPPPLRPSPRAPSRASTRRSKNGTEHESVEDKVPKFKKEFDRFHSENGVRTVMGSIGPVKNVRMLLKSGYRHVYISRKFAIKHGFIPLDAAPGNYGYGGLVNIGTWPITLTPSSSQPNFVGHHRPDAFPPPSPTPSHTPYSSPRIPVPSPSPPPPLALAATNSNDKSKTNRNVKKGQQNKPKSVSVQVYLSEEPHFDVVLGRSFFEKRQIKTTAVDPTDVVCLDTGEKIECELVILKDGKGEIVTVT